MPNWKVTGREARVVMLVGQSCQHVIPASTRPCQYVSPLTVLLPQRTGLLAKQVYLKMLGLLMLGPPVLVSVSLGLSRPVLECYVGDPMYISSPQ